VRDCKCVWKRNRRFLICSQCQPLVIIESPFAGDQAMNVAYARECLADSLARGEAPFASHLLYPQVLDDNVPARRKQGIEAGLAWGHTADLTAIYTDLGISEGMKLGIERAQKEGRRIVYRQIRAENPPHYSDR